MAAEESSAAELTPEQKIEEMLLGPAEPEPQEDLLAEDAEPEAVEAEGDTDIEVEGDDAELEAEAEEQPALEMFDIEIDGQVYEVPPVIRDRLEQAEDYTQKTQATAEERKALDVVRNELDQKAEEYRFLESVEPETQRAQTIDWQIKELRNYMRDNIDSLTGNQLEKVRWQMDELSTEKDGIVQAIRAKYGEHQQAVEQARKELRDKSTETLRSRLPNWGEDAEKQSLAYGRELGFTDDELALALDPRERQVLWEASEYRRIKAGTGEATRKLKRGPKLKTKARSATSNETKRKISVRKRLNNATTEKQKADIIREDIAQRFKL